MWHKTRHDVADSAKYEELGQVLGSGRKAASAWESLDQYPTANMQDFVRGLISDATKNDDALRLHLKLFKFARSTALAVIAAALIASLIFGAGVALVVAVAGGHAAVTISIGASGSATFVVTAGVLCRRYVKSALTALSGKDPHHTTTGPKGPYEDANQRTAARQ